MGMRAKIVGTGMCVPDRVVTNDELEALFARATVYAQPSLHEGFGAAVAEAMSRGCVPVVSTRGSLPEVVGDSGFYVPPEDPDALAEAIRRVVNGRDRHPSDAAQRIRARYSLASRREHLTRVVARVYPALRIDAPDS